MVGVINNDPTAPWCCTPPPDTPTPSKPTAQHCSPALAQSTGELDLPTDLIDPETDRMAMMPRRKRTREEDHRARITAERRERTELIAEQQRQHQAWIAATYQPPPF